MNRDALLLLSVMFVAPILSGCGLIYDYDNCPAGYGEFDVEDDWRLAPSATPEGMAYIFFPSGENSCWRFDFPGKEGGDVDLPDGDYNVLTFNDDTSGILFDNSESYRDFTFYCRPGALYDGLGGTIDNPLGPPVAANGEKVNICPDMLWCDAVNTFELYPDGTAVERTPDSGFSYSDKRRLTMYPKAIVAFYRYSVRNVENLESIDRVCASISGMAASLRPSDMWRGTEPVTLPLKATPETDCMISGRFFTYGLPCEPSAPNTLSLYIWLTDGRKMCYEFDVTNQIRKAPDSMNVEIIIDGLKLPEVENPKPGGTFDVSVDGWATIIIDIAS